MTPEIISSLNIFVSLFQLIFSNAIQYLIAIAITFSFRMDAKKATDPSHANLLLLWNATQSIISDAVSEVSQNQG